MRVERAGFLACVAALAACGRAPEPLAAPPTSPSVIDVRADDLGPRGAPDASAVPARQDPAREDPPPAAVALPACAEPDVPPCVDFGLPGPTCEQGMEPGVDCVRLRGLLRPDAARAAVSCLLERRGTCRVHDVGSASQCFLASLSSACERPGARAACAPIVAKCGKRLEEEICVAEVSAVVDQVRDQVVACLAKTCDPRCDRSLSLRGAPEPPPRPTVKAPPSRAAAEIAKWKVGAPLPAEWTACRLTTDCETIPTSMCGSYAVNRRSSAYVSEVLRRTPEKRSTRGFTVSCAGPGMPACVAGVCK